MAFSSPAIGVLPRSTTVSMRGTGVSTAATRTTAVSPISLEFVQSGDFNYLTI